MDKNLFNLIFFTITTGEINGKANTYFCTVHWEIHKCKWSISNSFHFIKFYDT